MKNLMLIIALISLVSCDQYDYIEGISIDSRLQKSYDAFYLEAELRGISLERKPIKMEFADIDVMGLSSGSVKGLIQINPFWLKMDSINQDYIINHELGHYLLGRNHKDDILDNGFPASIMHHKKVAYTVGRESEREYYLDELFEVL